MDNNSIYTNKSMDLDIDEWNKKWNKLKLQQAFENYTLQVQKYQEDCAYKFFQLLEISFGSPESTRRNSLMAIQHIISVYRIFDNINLFVLNKKGEIFCIKDLNFVFNKNNYQEVFFKFKYFTPHTELIDSFYEVLSLRKGDRKYWKYHYYKYQNHCNNCIFDHAEFFRIFDDNVLFDITPFSKEAFPVIRASIDQLLYSQTYKLPITINNHLASQPNNVLFSKLRQPTLGLFKTIIDLIKINYHKISSIDAAIHKEQSLLQLILYHLQQNHHLSISPPTNTQQEPLVWINGHPKHILEERQKSLSFSLPPSNVISYLSILTAGSSDTLDQLAMLLARINLIKNSTITSSLHILPKISIILTSTIPTIKNFLGQLYPEGKKMYKSIHDLCRKKTIIENISFKLNGGILHICEHNKNLCLDDLKILKKFVNHVSVRIQDKAVGKITYLSNSHYVILTKNQEEALIYKNYFQNLSEIIVINDTMTADNTIFKQKTSLNENPLIDQFILPPLENLDYEWLHTIFATYGLLLLSKTKKSLSKKQLKLENIQALVSSFLNDFCIHDISLDCYADELYAYFSAYVIREYHVEPIKKIHFVNILKMTGQYLYFRPRHHAKDNRWGFKGIAINKDKWAQHTKITTGTQCNPAITKTFKYITFIDQEIRPLIGIN